jgi:hypothetical protein
MLETFMVPPYGLTYGDVAVKDRYRISVQQRSKVGEVEVSGENYPTQDEHDNQEPEGTVSNAR